MDDDLAILLLLLACWTAIAGWLIWLAFIDD